MIQTSDKKEEVPDFLYDFKAKGLGVSAWFEFRHYNCQISVVDAIGQLNGIVSGCRITPDNTAKDFGKIGSADVQRFVQHISCRKVRDRNIQFHSLKKCHKAGNIGSCHAFRLATCCREIHIVSPMNEAMNIGDI